MLQCDHAAQRSTNAHLGLPRSSLGFAETVTSPNTSIQAAELAKSRKFESPYANTSSPFISRSGGCATLGLDAFRRSSRYQENNSVNQQCHAGHYPKRGECVAYLGLWLPSLVPSCYACHVVCNPARYKSHTPHYIAREWADLPFFFCIRLSRSPSRHPCGLWASKPAARPRSAMRNSQKTIKVGKKQSCFDRR